MNRDVVQDTASPSLLDPLRLPLRGSSLIEASAGTGKTFTIAALYLRLVLGHGGNDAFTKPLTPPEILVVTFTDAATKELRDRIRARLAQASSYFLQDPDEVVVQPPGRDLLYDLRDDYPPDQWPHCARKLQLAAEWMDEAAVSTIHGWCNRMLHEHAFDSNSLFTQRLETDQSDLLAEVVRDYWRTFLYPLDTNDAAAVLAWWASPDVLQAQLRRLLSHAAAMGAGRAPFEALSEARLAAEQALRAIKAPWLVWVDELETLLDDAVSAKQVIGAKIQKRFYGPWMDALREWAANPTMVAPPFKGDAAWKRLCVAGIAEAWKPDLTPPHHPALDALEGLRERLAQLPDAREAVLCHATTWVNARFNAEQERRAQIGFDDLLSRLDHALQGANGERLADLIRRQFPVAMIDEFQDTDPLQYRIFNAIYRVADNSPDVAVILIGDPKQAIYAFRGADIHTYLHARRHAHPRHYTLGTNFRSTREMVSATNHLFEHAERRALAGAFLFKRDGGDGAALPFIPVVARGREETWIDGDAASASASASSTASSTQAAPALTAWYLSGENAGKRGHYVDHYSQVCASEIARLLRLGQAGQAGFTRNADHPGPRFTALAPGDIAVLVNTGKEASAIRRALSAYGVRSVYLSDKESVFESASAAELQRWLAACAEPDNDRLLRAALATVSLGMSVFELDRLGQDEMAWEARVDQFRFYQQCWRRQGVLPMLRRLMHDFGVPGRLIELGNERGLTDFLHLAELLQQASVLLDGEHALVRHLAEQRDQADDESDVRKLRLESDADLVKVVTVHKSKGLEYPLVFLPFAAKFRSTNAKDLPLKWHDEDDQLQVGLRANDTVLAAADHERLGEDLRKLYVALTRARFATWIGLAPLEDLHRSGLGHLLSGGEPIPEEALAKLLQDVCRGCEAVSVIPAPEPNGVPFVAQEVPRALLPPRTLASAVRESWWIASYSALHVDVASQIDAALPIDTFGEAPDTASRDVYAEAADDAVPLPFALPLATSVDALSAMSTHGQMDAPAPGSLHAFPRGANPGTFLHGILEWAGREGFADVLADPSAARDMIARGCSVRGWDSWIEILYDWLVMLLARALRLPGPSHADADMAVSLADLRGYQIELEFWFSVDHVDTRALDALVTQQTLAGKARPALLANHLNGMFKGFIDLVFEHEGRYYVVDYKSNFLGPSAISYHRAAMEAAVLGKRYDLQYVIYLFALHRLLRARLPDYDYEQHVGGALYLFLRGIEADSLIESDPDGAAIENDGTHRGMFFERPPVGLMHALDRMFEKRTEEEGAA